MKEEDTFDIVRKWTSTNLFVVPLLGIDRLKLLDNDIINAYNTDEVKGINYENGVYLLFKPENKQSFYYFLEDERKRKASIIDEYDYEQGLIMVVYQYASEWEKDVKLINEGKFSKLSGTYQDFVPKTMKKLQTGIPSNINKETLTIQHKIIKCVPELAEYWNNKFGLELEYNNEHWHHYMEREVFSNDILNKLTI